MEPPRNYLIDMDGVLISGQAMIPDADRFLARLQARGAKYVVLTNNSRYTPGDLAHRLHAIGLDIPAERIFTSAIATARFMRAQHPKGTAYVVGESGLTEAIHQAGYVITDHNPDYVVLGEAPHYTMEALTSAVRLVMAGAHFIVTNPDPSGPGEGGLVPACGAVAALVERASGVSPFFVGKPNPLMMRTALNYMGVHSENTVMVGDRMDTDIVAGVLAGIETILVLSGVTDRAAVARYPYQPTHVVESVAEIEP
jgi:NagD protein